MLSIVYIFEPKFFILLNCVVKILKNIDSFPFKSVFNSVLNSSKNFGWIKKNLIKKLILSACLLYSCSLLIILHICDFFNWIHKNNKKRVVRALELHYLGSSKTEQNENSQKEKSPYDFLYFVLQYENRQTLYDRINLRVDKMLENGLLDEARAMQGKCQKTCAQAIGHKELARYLNGEASLEECAQKLKQESRRYAKRQITWFKRRQGAVFISMDKLKGSAAKTVIDKCEDFLNG